MTQLTKERLEQFIKSPLDNGLTRGEQMEMARQLLAGLEQEPVAWRYRFVHTPKSEEHGSYFTTDWVLTHSEDECNPSDCFERQALYAAPQLPQPAVVSFEEWSRKCDLQIELCDREFRDKAQYIWNACRAAMLQGKADKEDSANTIQTAPALDLYPKNDESPTTIKPVADLYSIVVPGGRSTTYSTDAAEASDCRVMGWAVQEYVMLERYQAAMLQGKAEPVSQPCTLPDGMVAVPVEPTHEMLNAWLSEIANWRGHVAGYKAMLAAAPQQESDNG